MQKLQFFDIPIVLAEVRNSARHSNYFSSANHLIIGLARTNHRDLVDFLRKTDSGYTHAGEGGSVAKEHLELICEEEWVEELQQQLEQIAHGETSVL